MTSEGPTTTPLVGTAKIVAVVTLLVLLLALLVVSLLQRSYAEPLFIHATYYFLLVTVICWILAYVCAAKAAGWPDLVGWFKDNKAGIIVAALVTLIAALAVHPALRVLADEANLLGTSRSFFTTKTATFTTTGKYYYDNFWDAGVVIDRRPSLFPFLVSLVHVVRGYQYTNVFLFNLACLFGFVLVAYRLAKSLGGETFGVAAALLVTAHPITLITVRSGAFDFFAAFFAVLVLKSFLDHARDPSPERLAVLWMNLCMFAEIRYETALFLPPMVVALLVFRLMKWEHVRRYALLFALTPAFLLPRIWQSILRGNVPEQDPGAVTFGFANFLANTREYFKPAFAPFDFHMPHGGVVIALGIVGALLLLHWLDRRFLLRQWKTPEFKFAVVVLGWMALLFVIVFLYVWGRAQHPAASRLMVAIDTFFSFTGAWALCVLLRRWRPAVTIVLASALFVVYLPVAAEHRSLNELTLTREAAETWRYFESLHEKRILIVAERPGLYTIMECGALDFESAKNDPSLLDALARHLFYDIYLIQQIDLATNEPLPQYRIWPERPRVPVLEFQNDANATIRISRLLH